MAKFDSSKELTCSFCGKPQSQVRRLIAGPDVYICDECVKLCDEILAGKLADQFPLAVWQTGRLMPRELLHIGLGRMDFVLARQYAQKVLQTDPDYSPANFAMGMSFLKEEQYNKAASYLRRCVEKDPNDVSAWNNLAVVYQRQGSLDEALAAAERAVEAAQALKTPQVRERAVKDVDRTLRYIQRLREKKAQK